MNETEPIESGHDDATADDKLSGVIEQMRGDIEQGNVDDVREALRQRLADTGIRVDDDEIDKIVADLS